MFNLVWPDATASFGFPCHTSEHAPQQNPSLYTSPYSYSILLIFPQEFTTTVHAFFYKQRYFSTQPQCCLTFSWIELQMSLKCCLIRITIIILWHILHLVYLGSCLDLGLFMSYLYDLFFIVSLIFIAINHTTSLKHYVIKARHLKTIYI